MIEIDGKVLRIGLALSGGGFRASIFHMGVMRRLQELEILEKIDVISAVSGGAIVGAYYCLNRAQWRNLADVEKGFTKGLQKNIRFRGLTASFVFHPIMFIHSWFPGFTRTNIVADEFDKHFFHGATLGVLPESPKLVVNATNLNSGAVWRFTRDQMGDWKFGGGPAGDFAVKDAVGASAAVPGIFAPLVVPRSKLAAMKVKPDFQHHNRVSLVDGGIRDNQGLTDLLFEDRCDYIVASDASQPLDSDATPPKMFVNVLLRSNTITMDAARDWLVEDLRGKKQSGEIRQAAYFTLKDKVQNEPDGLPEELVEKVQGIRTDLDYFDDDEILALKYHGYTLTDDRVKRYASELIRTRDTDVKWREEFPKERIAELEQALAKSHKRRLRPYRF